MKVTFLCLALVALPALADNATAVAPATGTTTTAGAQGQRGEKIKEALAKLNLTDDQKQKIEQIRANTAAGPARRQQIMAVLTPEQKQKLMAMFAEWKQNHPSAGGGAAASGEN